MDHPSFFFNFSFYRHCRLVHLSIRSMLCIFIFFWHTPSLATLSTADIDCHKPARTSYATCLLVHVSTQFVSIGGSSVVKYYLKFNPLAQKLDIYSLAHHLCKM